VRIFNGFRLNHAARSYTETLAGNKELEENMAVIQVTGQIGGTIEGTNEGDDILAVLTFGTQINGGNGDDEIRVLLSAFDLVDGGNGADQIYFVGTTFNTATGGNGGDWLDASALTGPADLTGGNGTDYLAGGIRGDFLDGGNGNDALYGAGGNDSVRGGRGDDAITGGTGNDTASGGQGRDSFYYNYSATASSAFGTDGNDQITDFNVLEDTLHLHDTNASGGINTNRIVLTDNGSSTTILIDNPINVLDRTIILDGVSGFADLNAAVAAGWLVFS
jgi:Ca2+-binding RTX toxin-like protein